MWYKYSYWGTFHNKKKGKALVCLPPGWCGNNRVWWSKCEKFILRNFFVYEPIFTIRMSRKGFKGSGSTLKPLLGSYMQPFFISDKPHRMLKNCKIRIRLHAPEQKLWSCEMVHNFFLDIQTCIMSLKLKKSGYDENPRSTNSLKMAYFSQKLACFQTLTRLCTLKFKVRAKKFGIHYFFYT